MENIHWRVPSVGALLLVLVFMPHLFSKVPYVNAAWVSNFLLILLWFLSTPASSPLIKCTYKPYLVPSENVMTVWSRDSKGSRTKISDKRNGTQKIQINKIKKILPSIDNIRDNFFVFFREMKIVLNQKRNEKREKKKTALSWWWRWWWKKGKRVEFVFTKKHTEKRKNPCQAMLLLFSCLCVPHTFYNLIIK